MPVSYILKQAGAKIGLSPSAQSSRNTLLRFLNEAAEELYDQSDPPGSLMEQVFKVNGDQTISCPSYVGEIRAVRELNSQLTWSINQMRPRYNQFNWTDNYRNLRLKNTQALMVSVTNQSVGVITVPAIESPPIVVSVSGPTLSASGVSEDVTMDTISKMTTNQYTDYTAVKKDRVNNYDVTLSDIDGKLMTVIPNNQLAANYQIIDVSLCPWLTNSQSTLDHYLEILYKKSLPHLQNDDDEYPAFDYDNIIVNKMLQLWFEEQGKADIAEGYDAKATRSVARKKENQNKSTEDKIALVSNPHDTLMPRVGKGPRTRGYRYYRP